MTSRADKLMTMPPQLMAEVMLYPSECGGRKREVRLGWGCPCCLARANPIVGYDGWPLLGDVAMAPGNRRRLGFVFLSGEETANLFRKAGRFFRWEGEFIGEAVVVTD
jgi:hypothetical protein